MEINRITYIIGAVLPLLLAACGVEAPERFVESAVQPNLFPDVKDVTIPVNIAPFTFYIDEEGDDFVTTYSLHGKTMLTLGGQEAVPSTGEWRKLMNEAVGGEIEVRVYRKSGGEWQAFAPFAIAVSTDSIDRYISYRLITPSFVSYEKLTISQRDLTGYDETDIYNNMLMQHGTDGQCINCHSYKNYKTDNMQFHVRQFNGGTLLVTDGRVRKVNLKTDSTLSAGVYPSFNPKYNVIAYSVNKTVQNFHTVDADKIEVQDNASDLVLYDYDASTVRIIEDDPYELEVFPSWAPDGETLYYCSARLPVNHNTEKNIASMMRANYQQIKYDIYRLKYNHSKRCFGEKDTLFAASKIGKSATLPRVSPDGRYLLFGMGDFGCFHVWHNSADLYLIDLANDSLRCLTEANSPCAESYHSWSSNGRWIMFVSRRDDGNFSRLYISHFDGEGRVGKPFELPQKSPLFYKNFYKSYNVPEFMVEPVRTSPREFVQSLQGDAERVTFVR